MLKTMPNIWKTGSGVRDCLTFCWKVEGVGETGATEAMTNDREAGHWGVPVLQWFRLHTSTAQASSCERSVCDGPGAKFNAQIPTIPISLTKLSLSSLCLCFIF